MVYDDPPDPTYHRLARVVPTARASLDLPSCASLATKERRACGRLERFATRYVAAVQRVTNVATALATTGNRYAAAAAAGNAQAKRKQARHAAKLSRRLDATRRARSRAGAKLVRALRSLDVSGALTDAQATQAVGLILDDLAAQGVATDRTLTIVGSAATPGAIDVLSVLAKP
jgi:hypothetical protein